MRDCGLCGSIAIAFFAIVCLASPSLAGSNLLAKVAVHVAPHDDARTCGVNFPEFDGPCDIRHTYVGCEGVDVFPVSYDLDEYKGFEYSLTWPGSSVALPIKRHRMWPWSAAPRNPSWFRTRASGSHLRSA